MGLLGLSMYRALAAGVSTARILSGLVLSTKFTVRPFLALTVFSRRVVPPYRSSEQMIWSPGRNSSKQALMAAMPEEKATVSTPCSSAVMVSSRC